MQAVVLAGGLGTRLKPLTEQIPKVMVSVNGKPFLFYLLELLGAQGINDVILCLGYLGEQIESVFQNGERLGIRLRYRREEEKLLGTGGALKQAQNLLDNHFFVINGDTYLPLNYEEVGRSFNNHGKKALMVVYDNKEDTGVKNNVGLDTNLIVKKYDKAGGDPTLKYVEAGVLVLKREAMELIEERCPVSLEEGLYPALIQQQELAAYVTKRRFYDIGTLEQLRLFEEYLTKERK